MLPVGFLFCFLDFSCNELNKENISWPCKVTAFLGISYYCFYVNQCIIGCRQPTLYYISTFILLLSTYYFLLWNLLLYVLGHFAESLSTNCIQPLPYTQDVRLLSLLTHKSRPAWIILEYIIWQRLLLGRAYLILVFC